MSLRFAVRPICRQHLASASRPSAVLLVSRVSAGRKSRSLWSWSGPDPASLSLWEKSRMAKSDPVSPVQIRRSSTNEPGKQENSPQPPSKAPLRQRVTAAKDLAKAKATTLTSSAKAALASATPHENIYTLPNFLTLTRLIAAPLVGYFVVTEQHVAALSLFAYAGITDAVDGWIARKWKLQTVVGTIIDPLADKTLMTILTVTLATKGLLPLWLAVVILGRDVGLAISAIYYRWISLPPPKTMARYWDFSLPSAEVRPTQISKINTALQLGLIGATTALPVVGAGTMLGGVELGVLMTGFQYLVGGTTVWSGLSYVWSKDAVKILKPEEIAAQLAAKGKKGVEKESEDGTQTKA